MFRMIPLAITATTPAAMSLCKQCTSWEPRYALNSSMFTTSQDPEDYTDEHYNSPTPGRIGVEPAELGGQADCLREAGKV